MQVYRSLKRLLIGGVDLTDYVKRTVVNIFTAIQTFNEDVNFLKKLKSQSVDFQNQLDLKSENTYGGVSLSSTSLTFAQFFGRLQLKGFGEVSLENNYHYVPDPRGSKLSLRPGTGNWKLLCTEPDPAVDNGGCRMVYHANEITDLLYNIRGFNSDADLDDTGKILYGNNASAQIFTLPQSNDIDSGWNITIFQKGLGQITVYKDANDVLNVASGLTTKTRLQFSALSVNFDGVEFYINGDLEAI